jgi:hypothetical protein
MDRLWASMSGFSAPSGQSDSVNNDNGLSRSRARYFNEAGAHPEHPTPGSSRSGSGDIDSTLASLNAGTSSEAQPSRGPRIRVSKACTPCRRVKLKCNGETPCGRCSALNLAMDECTYPPSLRGKTRRKKLEIEVGPHTPEGNEAVEGQTAQKRSRVGEVGDGERDTRRLDHGPTLTSMNGNGPRWRYDENSTAYSSRNDIWNPDEHPSSHRSPNGSSSIPNSRRYEASALDHNTIRDTYPTSLPPGDAHNPLGVLAEASATAGSAVPSPSSFQPAGGAEDDHEGRQRTRRYYGLPERGLKEEYPHILSIISSSE